MLLKGNIIWFKHVLPGTMHSGGVINLFTSIIFSSAPHTCVMVCEFERGVERGRDDDCGQLLGPKTMVGLALKIYAVLIDRRCSGR